MCKTDPRMECWGQPRQYFSLCPPRLVRGSPYTVLLTNTFSITLPQSLRSGRAHTPKGEARPHTLTTNHSLINFHLAFNDSVPGEAFADALAGAGEKFYSERWPARSF